uniref:Uncharacterized protein n=1 Tax=Oryctolagus cuniculus TaxID=9986 RepID=A0A5F9CP96_RABIT
AGCAAPSAGRTRAEATPHPVAPGSPHFPLGRGEASGRAGGGGPAATLSSGGQGESGAPPPLSGRGHSRRAEPEPGARPGPRPGPERTRAGSGPAHARPPPRVPASPASPGPRPGTFDHVAVDGGAELLARALVEVLPVDDPHLLQESGLAALARAQQQDLHEPLHVESLGSTVRQNVR